MDKAFLFTKHKYVIQKTQHKHKLASLCKKEIFGKISMVKPVINARERYTDNIFVLTYQSVSNAASIYLISMNTVLSIIRNLENLKIQLLLDYYSICMVYKVLVIETAMKLMQ